MVFVIKTAAGEVYDLAVPNEETLMLNLPENAQVWLKGNPDAPEHYSPDIPEEEE